MIEDWEAKRLCVSSPKPHAWDADASRDDHDVAAWICVKRCPVSDQCERKVRADFAAGVNREGLYAGAMWSRRGGRHDVAEWHATHGTTRGPALTRQAIIAADVRCAAEECTVLFPRIGRKVYCSRRCLDRAHQRKRRSRTARSA